MLCDLFVRPLKTPKVMSRNPHSYWFTPVATGICAATLLVALSACRDSHVAIYQAPKDPPPQPPPALAAGESAPAPRIHWVAPAHWKPSAPPGAASNMRTGSFTITADDGSGRTADMAVTTFPGDVGGDLANINRWRGQLKLAPITAAQLPSARTTVNTPAGEFFLADMTGDETPRKRTLGAWFKQPAQNRTWFFKLTGDAELVAAEREAFLAFLRTVTFSDPT
jgi:hypothetical protein